MTAGFKRSDHEKYQASDSHACLLSRSRTPVDLEQVREHSSAAAIQATWRMLGDRRTAERLRKDKLFREMGQVLATRIQAGWWGYRWERVGAACTLNAYFSLSLGLRRCRSEIGSLGGLRFGRSEVDREGCQCMVA